MKYALSIRMMGFAFILGLGRVGFGDNGYTLTTLSNFDSPNNSPGGSFIRDSAGNFYGTSLFGGTFGLGSVYEADSTSGFSVSTIASLNGPLPNSTLKLRPFGVVMDAAGNLYGSQTFGGTAGKGSIFKVDTTPQHNVTTLLSLDGSHGQGPSGILQDPLGNMYIAAQSFIYQMTAANGYVPTQAFTLPAGTSLGGQADTSGNLYGWATGASATAVRFDASNSFMQVTLGAAITGITGTPTSMALDTLGNIYGIGNSGVNTYSVFKLDASNNYAQLNLGTIKSLPGDFATSVTPTSLTIDAAGNLFGITQTGGANGGGTVFELAAANNYAFVRLINFNGTNGFAPVTNLIVDGSGSIYGQTSSGGLSGDGTIFKLTPVPEPSGVMMLTLGAGFWLSRRRRG